MSEASSINNTNNTVSSRERQLANLKPFKPGQVGNPKGRPKGSRSKLSEKFLRDCHKAWKELGAEALVKMAQKQPAQFCTMVAGILPKDFQVSVTDDSNGKWVINAQPMSIDDWQREHGLIEGESKRIEHDSNGSVAPEDETPQD